MLIFAAYGDINQINLFVSKRWNGVEYTECQEVIHFVGNCLISEPLVRNGVATDHNTYANGPVTGVYIRDSTDALWLTIIKISVKPN